MKNSDLVAKVKAASYADIEQILRICEQNLVNNNQKLSTKDLSQRGFLLNKLTEDQVRKMVDDPENFLVLVLKKSDEVLGYLIACDISKTEKEFQEKIYHFPELKKPIGENSDGRLFYYRQIAKKIGEKKVGEKLLLVMFEEAKKRGYGQLFCKIVHEPFYNVVSAHFHQKFGFEKIGVIEENGGVRGVYLKNLAASIAP